MSLTAHCCHAAGANIGMQKICMVFDPDYVDDHLPPNRPRKYWDQWARHNTLEMLKKAGYLGLICPPTQIARREQLIEVILEVSDTMAASLLSVSGAAPECWTREFITAGQ